MTYKIEHAWQIVRVKARSIKDPTDKVIYVMDWPSNVFDFVKKYGDVLEG